MKTRSFLRIEEYKRLAKLHLDGEILDVGGSKKSGYHELIKGNHKITTANIDASYGTDVIFDAQQTWPVADASYSGVLFINVLEHVFDYKAAVNESCRVLKNGGLMIGIVPMMFNVHGSPSDYFRYTRFSIEKITSEAGFKSVEITELGTGAFSVIYHCLIGFMKWSWMYVPAMYIARKLDGLVSLLKPNNKMSAKFMPLGYYFEAKK